MKLTKEQRNELRQGMTPGPWRAEGEDSNDQPMIVSDETGRLVAVCCHEGVASLEAEAEANARATTAVHDLLDDLDELEAEMERLRKSPYERRVGEPDRRKAERRMRPYAFRDANMQSWFVYRTAVGEGRGPLSGLEKHFPSRVGDRRSGIDRRRTGRQNDD